MTSSFSRLLGCLAPASLRAAVFPVCGFNDIVEVKECYKETRLVYCSHASPSYRDRVQV